jgi:hypothetical protein
MSFGAGVARWTAESTDEIKEFHAEIIFRLYKSVIKDTPVLEGRLRGNWFPSKGNPSDKKDEDATQNASLPRVEEFILDFDGSEDFEVFLTNNLPYAARIEYDGHSSIKAPEGMVRKNLLRIAQLIRNKR